MFHAIPAGVLTPLPLDPAVSSVEQMNRSVSPPKTRKTTVTLLTGIIYTETWSGRKVGHYQQSKGNIFESHSSFLPHHNFSCTMFKKHIDVNCSCQKERMFLVLLMY